MKISTTIFTALVLVLMLVSSSRAQMEIYAVGSEFSDISQASNSAEIDSRVVEMFGASTLYKLDPETGAPTAIGPTGFYSCQGLDLHPATNDLYAVCNESLDFIDRNATRAEVNPLEGQVLVILNKTTGEGTKIGPLGGIIGIPFQGPFVSDISFSPNGTLYAYLISQFDGHAGDGAGIDTNFIEGIHENALGTINLTTGEFYLVGPSGVWDFHSAIAFQNQEDLFQCANFGEGPFEPHVDFNRLNPATGHATFIRELDLPAVPENVIEIITSKDADFETGIFYGLLVANEVNTVEEKAFPSVKTNNIEQEGNYLIRINPFSDTLDVIGLIQENDAFLAIAVKGEPRMVPTMSEYGLILTAIILMGAAVVFMRRRKAKFEI